MALTTLETGIQCARTVTAYTALSIPFHFDLSPLFSVFFLYMLFI